MVRLLKELLTQGRWSNLATCRIYLDEALQELGTLSIPPSASRALLLARQHFYRCKPGRRRVTLMGGISHLVTRNADGVYIYTLLSGCTITGSLEQTPFFLPSLCLLS